MPRSHLRAVVFDVYGTLLHVRRRLVAREIPRCLGISRSAWMALIRSELMTRAFPDVETFIDLVCDRLAPRAGLERRRDAERLVRAELASVEVGRGVLSLLQLLRRRGLRIGILSNLISPHKEPVERLGIAGRVDAAVYSCDVGAAKPDASTFELLCDRLGVDVDSTLMIGDSLHNDVLAARAAGLHALRVGPGPDALADTAELGWRSFARASLGARLIEEGQRVTLGREAGTVHALAPLADAQQGRYNLIGRASFVPHDGDGAARDVYCKRFLFPEAAHVEAFMHQLLAALDQPCCDVALTEGPEACLVLSSVAGEKLDREVTPDLAREIGRHGALAYMFANADLRPRNAFVAQGASGPIMTMIDLEHCLFNLALDVSGLDDPHRPETLDRLGDDELQRRLATRVLSPRATRRARRSFFEAPLDSPLGRAFADGWCATYRHVQDRSDLVRSMLERRMRQEPPLIIGTLAHRRAFARIDRIDLCERLAEDPVAALQSAF